MILIQIIHPQLHGFKIMDSKLANASLKIVEKLMDRNVAFEIQNILIYYDIQKFEALKVSVADLKFLEKIFDVDCNKGIGSFGVFPDILNDAYQNDVISDEQFQNLTYLDENE